MSDPSQPTELKFALIVAIDGDAANLSVRNCPKPPIDCGDSRLINVRVDSPALRTALKPFQAGDRVRLEVAFSKAPAKSDDASKADAAAPSPETGNATTAAVLTDVLGAYSQPLDRLPRFFVLFFTALALLGIATVVTKGRPFVFVVGMDNRYSNSKVQVALWFWIVISTYLAAWVFRVHTAGWNFAGMVNIPQNLLLLSGLSAITYGGAKAITTSKADAALPAAKAEAAAQTLAATDAQARLTRATAALANVVAAQPVTDEEVAAAKQEVTDAQAAADAVPTVVAGVKTKATEAQKNFFLNLVQNDAGGFDFGDFQMLIVTAVAAATYLILFFHFFDNVAFTKAITLPDLDTTILSIFGLGQGAYLAKKAGGDVGTS